MEPNSPTVNLTDSVQVGHNAIGPTTGDIIINSGNSTERCNMCKTPIDANTNLGLYCFKDWLMTTWSMRVLVPWMMSPVACITESWRLVPKPWVACGCEVGGAGIHWLPSHMNCPSGLKTGSAMDAGMGCN
jgi:hypothetical protein